HQGAQEAGAAQGADLRAQERQPQVSGGRTREVPGVAHLPATDRRDPIPPARALCPGVTHVLVERAPRPASCVVEMSTAPPTPTRPKRGDELELTIDALAFGGAGVARTEGYVVFVTGGIPGDRVRAVIGKRKRAYAEARAVEIIEPGPDRIAPVADHPGAPWQVLSYQRQLEVKQGQVDDALRRIGKLEGFALEPIVPAVSQWRYRNKLEYSFGSDASGALVCGFHAPGRWDEIVAMDDCLLASEPANAAREQIVAWCRAEGLSAYDRRSGDGLLRNL